ncbi:MAG: hypothetical protein ABGW81_09910 [Paracoccaceae bacterium]
MPVFQTILTPASVIVSLFCKRSNGQSCVHPEDCAKAGSAIAAPRKNVLGRYFAGTVEEIGGGATKFKSGNAIYGETGIGFGALGEYIRLSEKNTLAI